jgi:3-oxoadipate enol-lactonase
MATIEVNGTGLYYVDTGPGSTGETIVFSHGLLWGTELFEAQIAALRGRYRCIAWDHRGQGQSDPDLTRENISMELVWQDAVLLLEALCVAPVHFCGLSMGGFVGMRMAARRPDLVRSLMLLETSSEIEPVENLKRYRLLIKVVKLLGPWAVKSSIAPIMFGNAILTDPARKADVERYTTLLSRRKDGWRAVNGVIDRAPIHSELGRIKTPTLVVVGDQDVATPIPKAETIVSAIAGAKLVKIARAGHSSPVEEPSAVTEALTTFLSSLSR